MDVVEAIAGVELGGGAFSAPLLAFALLELSGLGGWVGEGGRRAS